MATVALTHLLATGSWGTVQCVVLGSGAIPAKKFLDEDCDAAIRARFAVLFQQMADNGQVSPKRFKKEMGQLSAFRHEIGKRQIRFPCFRDGNSWLVTHGFFKPGAKKGLGDWPDNEVRRAGEIAAEYARRKEAAKRSKT